MRDLQKVINFLLSPNTSLTITISEHYGSEIEFLPGGEEVVLWEEGRPWRCPVEADCRAFEYVLMAKFAIALWGEEAVDEDYSDLDVATQDILRRGNWPEGNLQEVGGEEALRSVRSWPHYNRLQVALQPLMDIYHS